MTSKSTVVVIKMIGDSVLECSHTIEPPAMALIQATGGMLTVSNTDEPVAVICGGQDSTNNDAKDMCTILVEAKRGPPTEQLVVSGNGFLNNKRIGAASVVLNNGSSLWVTGGFESQEEGFDDSVIVAILSNASSSSSAGLFSTNAAGPRLPYPMFHHCLQKIGPEVAVATGIGEKIVPTPSGG